MGGSQFIYDRANDRRPPAMPGRTDLMRHAATGRASGATRSAHGTGGLNDGGSFVVDGAARYAAY